MKYCIFQPPWYTTYIHVLDLPKFIVQLLVDLAYTGEMRLQEELQSDVFDAMQTLGWVHTDCLSADYDSMGESDVYDGAKSPVKDKEERASTAEKNKQKNNSETVLKMNFPSVDKPKTSPQRSNPVSNRNSFAEEDESMEISQLPDVDWSDGEDFNADRAPGTPFVKNKIQGKQAIL